MLPFPNVAATIAKSSHHHPDWSKLPDQERLSPWVSIFVTNIGADPVPTVFITRLLQAKSHWFPTPPAQKVAVLFWKVNYTGGCQKMWHGPACKSLVIQESWPLRFVMVGCIFFFKDEIVFIRHEIYARMLANMVGTIPESSGNPSESGCWGADRLRSQTTSVSPCTRHHSIEPRRSQSRSQGSPWLLLPVYQSVSRSFLLR